MRYVRYFTFFVRYVRFFQLLLLKEITGRNTLFENFRGFAPIFSTLYQNNYDLILPLKQMRQ